MSQLKQKINSDYWRNKLEKNNLKLKISRTLDATSTIQIRDEDIRYFKQLTQLKDIANYTVLLSLYAALLNRYFSFTGLVASHKLQGKHKTVIEIPTIELYLLRPYIKEIKQEVLECYNHIATDKNFLTSVDLQTYTYYSFNYFEVSEQKKLSTETTFNFIIKRENSGWEFDILYNPNYFPKYVVDHFLTTFKRWLINLEEIIETSVEKIPLLTKNEIESFTKNSDQTKERFENIALMTELFEAQVKQRPDATALIFETKHITYRELNQKANVFANYLKGVCGIEKGDRVAVQIERNEYLVVALLGVIKTGASYIPLEINTPRTRLDYILKNSECKVLINTELVDSFEESDSLSYANLNTSLNPSDIAYIIYTSGTTGVPKGVQITNENLAMLMNWAIDEFKDTPASIIYAATTQCFDLSVFEMFYPLVAGKTIRLLENALQIESYLQNDANILLNTVPSAIKALLSKKCDFTNVTAINLAGEIFPVTTAHKLLQRTSAEIRNLYGPTEDTTYSTCYRLSSSKKYNYIPIGKPILHTDAYVLDSFLQPVPTGVKGELFLSGKGLSKGYVNQPELTNERFIANPFDTQTKIYATGDLVSRLPDGNLRFYGRKDHQIKFRGYRIELEEIENSILSFSKKIKSVATVLYQNNNIENLIAYYTANETIDRNKLKHFLSMRMPAYMIPIAFVYMHSLPMLPNGKIDRKSLKKLPFEPDHHTPYVEASTPIEKALLQIWQQILGIEKIGIKDNFFELGGHSLMIMQVINKIYEELNGTITYQEFTESPSVEQLARRIKTSVYKTIPTIQQQSSYAVTPAQHRIWVLSQLENANQAYNMPGVIRIKGDLDSNLLEETLWLLIKKYEILRTSFEINNEGEVVQKIHDLDSVDFKVLNFDYQNQSIIKVNELLRKEQLHYFDLSKTPLLRISLIKIANDEHLLSFTMHHIIGDGWSLEIIIAEFTKWYNELTKQSKISPELPQIQYKDYAAWLMTRIREQSFLKAESYWLKKISGTIPVLNLPCFNERPVIQTYHGTTLQYKFNKDIFNSLQQFAVQEKTTLFTVLFTGINLLLKRYTNQQDIVLGTPVAGRDHPQLEDQIGLFLNTLAIRTYIDDIYSFRELVQKQKEILAGAYQFQQYPFDLLVQKLDLERDTSRSPLFDIMVVMQNQSKLETISRNSFIIEGLTISPYELSRDTAQFDLSFNFVERDNLFLELEYNIDIYDERFAKTLCNHLENLLKNTIGNPDVSTNEIIYLSPSEEEQILKQFAGSVASDKGTTTIIDLFENEVTKNPDKPALIYKDITLTYKELNEEANRLSHYLKAHYTIEPNQFIVFKLDRNERLLVTILGILKAGAAYVPIDPKYPKSRIDYLLEEIDYKVFIDNSFYDQYVLTAEKYSAENSAVINNLDDFAYMIYTSGTTGNPKGVMVSHKNLSSISAAWKTQYQLTSFKVNLLQLASVSFDVFAGDLCRSLLTGGTMIIAPEDTKLDPRALYSLIRDHEISILEGTPAMLLPLLDFMYTGDKEYKFLKRIIFGSDSFDHRLFTKAKERFESDQLKLINSYGVTEATIDSTFYEETDTQANGVTPIGKPFANTEIYILDTSKNLVPVGVYGEVHIGGNGVSKGYYKKPDLTKSKFIRIPFSKNKVYATGDVARWMPDGNIAFLGRNDDQVKVRGFRIELGEIEATAQKFSSEISHTLAAIKEITGEKVLVLYYTAFSEIDKTLFKNFLLSELPAYMVPDFYMQLDTMPLTPNGKLARNQLPEVSEDAAIKKAYKAPNNATERSLLTIWQKVLGIQEIGILDDFFDLGGHSLKITKLRNEILKDLNASLSFNDLFYKTTIEQQAKLIMNATSEDVSYILPVLNKDHYPLATAQQRIWVLSQFEGYEAAYNMPGVLNIKGDLDVDALREAFDKLIEHYEILRTRFKQDDEGEIFQQVLSPRENNFKLHHIKSSSHGDNISFKNQLIESAIKYEFKLHEESLLRATLIEDNDISFTLVFVIHHIISDGWSIDILTNFLFEQYNTIASGESKSPPELPIHYKDYAVWERENLQSKNYKESKVYWKHQFSGEIPVLELPFKTERFQTKSFEGKTVVQHFPKYLVSEFKRFCSAQDVTLFMGLMAVTKVLLFRYTNQKEIVVGTPVAGREHFQLKDQIGVFINTLALKSNFDGNFSFLEVLRQVKYLLLEAYEHQNYPFDALIEALNIPRDLSRNPLFDVMVTLQNTDEENREINWVEGLQIEELTIKEGITAKFDLDFIFNENDTGLTLTLVYNKALFEEVFVQEICIQLSNLMQQAIEHKNMPVSKLDFLGPSMKKQLLFNAKGKRKNLETSTSFLDLFFEHAQKKPDAPAIIDQRSTLSYSELNTLSTQIANYLKSVAEKDQPYIGVVLDRSVFTVAILMGIMKFGAAYIPLDPTFPLERLKYIVEHSQLKLLIHDPKFSMLASDKIDTITSEKILQEAANQNTFLEKNVLSSQAAYVIYTSGSTGYPKGVEISHNSLLNFLVSMIERPGMHEGDLLYAVTTYSFDISILEFFLPLVTGGSVFISSIETLEDAILTIEEIKELEPTIMQATPSFYEKLLHAGWEGNNSLKVLCGGDSLSSTLAKALIKANKELWNMYGPTETTVWSGVKQIVKASEASNIGTPILNTSFYVLDDYLQLLPLGAKGNLFIGGLGLAKGYFNSEGLTEERFIKNPFDTGRIYNTGDVVKWTSSGELTFHGRKDHQVKIRGYRIEIKDIEYHLNRIPTIEQAVVIPRKDSMGNSILAAFYRSNNSLEKSRIQQYLSQQLPHYMIPSYFVHLDTFPLTPNKKIDRKALEQIEITRSKEIDVNDVSEPQTEIEKKILLLWRRLFPFDMISTNDNFFDLGGHSLIATKLISLIKHEFTVQISVNKIFEYPTIREQALFIEKLILLKPAQTESDSSTEFENFNI
jgi:amino acid adenylation domain-containing protein